MAGKFPQDIRETGTPNVRLSGSDSARFALKSALREINGFLAARTNVLPVELV